MKTIIYVFCVLTIISGFNLVTVRAEESPVLENVVVGPTDFVFGPYTSGGPTFNFDNFSLSSLQNACLTDKNSDDCKKSMEADRIIQSNTLALDKSNGKLSCGYDKDAEFLSLSAGQNRLEIISDAVVVLDNPTAAKSIGDSADSQSVKMFSALESLGASGLNANEAISSENQSKLSQDCSVAKNISSDQLKGEIQLYTISCTIQNLVNKLVSLFKDRDTLSQQSIEMQSALNQALAENIKRDAQIKNEKENMKVLNNQIKDSLKKLKVAKANQEKAKESVTKAEDALKTAQATPCEQKTNNDTNDDDDTTTEDCSARDAAVATASASLDSAKKDLEKSVKELETSVKIVVELLVNKMGGETKAVLALLSGTIQGDAGGGNNVHFTVQGADFTLIDIGKTISSYAGVNSTDAKTFVTQADGFGSTNASDKQTNDYFSGLAKNYENSLLPNRGQNTSSTLSTKASGEVLNQLASMSNGADNLETIALAVSDYKNNKSDKLVNYFESMKTPQSRVDRMLKEIDKRSELIEKVKIMIEKNICYLDVNLKSFKDFYTLSTRGNSKPSVPLFEYLSKLTTAKFTKKFSEGYFSKENIDEIRTEIECLASGKAESSCVASSSTYEKPATGAVSCYWVAIVAGPVAPPANSCPTEGQTTSFSGYLWTCKCPAKN